MTTKPDHAVQPPIETDHERDDRVGRAENDGWVGKSISRMQRVFGWQTPLEIVRDLMMKYEEPLLLDGPDEMAFFANRLYRLLAAVTLTISFGLVEIMWVRLVILIVVSAIVISMAIGAIQDHYTRYVITTDRVMYISGFLSRTHMWIPYSKVTDLSFTQSSFERLVRVAKVRIESANEASPFRVLENLSKPKLFMHTLSTMVNIRQAPMRSKGGFGASKKKGEIMEALMDDIEAAGVAAWDQRDAVLEAVFDDWGPSSQATSSTDQPPAWVNWDDDDEVDLGE